jgi:hypothetical protein
MHGAAGGAPRGNRNAFKHGGCSTETIAPKREIQPLVRMARETMDAIESREAKRIKLARFPEHPLTSSASVAPAPACAICFSILDLF